MLYCKRCGSGALDFDYTPNVDPNMKQVFKCQYCNYEEII
jgi:hypothetical protein